MDKDTELVEQAKNGDLTAFRRLVEKHKRNVYYLAYDLTGSREDAEDVSQEVFIKAFRSLKNFRGDAKFSSWLYRITVNTSFSLKSSKSYSTMKKSESLDDIIDTKTEMTAPQNTAPEKKVESGFIQRNIEQALGKLSKRERTIFIMRNFNEMSFDEIVKVLKIQPGTVRSTNFKALQKLRKELAFYKDEI
ncbi:MAG TPA: sigma-70 family RNA polymerase sigma factor [Ignavibacteriaceae bacterium]|nr:sigma-70 family RNA polymerase sigma factor [Ignavibacteriaceae bacterium]